jgi:hypothetical protein
VLRKEDGLDKQIIKIRASSLSDYADCNRRAVAKVFPLEISAAGYELKTTTNSIGAVVGTATHEGAMWGLAEKMRTGELGNQTEAEQRSLEALKKERDLGVMYDDTTPDLNTAQKQVIRQLNSYRVHISPQIEPMAVEERVEAYVTDEVILTGQTDNVQHGEEDAVFDIRDLKTGVKEKAHGPQLGGYSLLQRSRGLIIGKAIVDYVPRVRLRDEQPLPTSTVYDLFKAEKLAWQILHRLKTDYDMFTEGDGDAEVFLPNPSSMLCSPKYCPAFGSNFCTHHLKPKTKELTIHDNPFL